MARAVDEVLGIWTSTAWDAVGHGEGDRAVYIYPDDVGLKHCTYYKRLGQRLGAGIRFDIRPSTARVLNSNILSMHIASKDRRRPHAIYARVRADRRCRLSRPGS